MVGRLVYKRSVYLWKNILIFYNDYSVSCGGSKITLIDSLLLFTNFRPFSISLKDSLCVIISCNQEN